MDFRKVNRLNELFEKMVSESADTEECEELKHLYAEFTNEGRDSMMRVVNSKQRLRASH